MDEQKPDIARALKDRNYYESLTSEQKALIPKNPAGEVALSDQDLESASGGLADGTGTGGSGSCFCNSSTGTGTGGCVCPTC